MSILHNFFHGHKLHTNVNLDRRVKQFTITKLKTNVKRRTKTASLSVKGSIVVAFMWDSDVFCASSLDVENLKLNY